MVKNTECLPTVAFSNVQMLAMLPLLLIHEDIPKACLKSFFFSK